MSSLNDHKQDHSDAKMTWMIECCVCKSCGVTCVCMVIGASGNDVAGGPLLHSPHCRYTLSQSNMFSFHL